MLLGLIFRGVAFEFRFKASDAERHVWDPAFIGGSVWPPSSRAWRSAPSCTASRWPTARMPAGRSTGSRRFRLSPASALLVAYALLGSTWLIMKTEGELQQRMTASRARSALLLLRRIAAISVWTPLAHPARRRALVQLAQPAAVLAGAAAGLAAACLAAARAGRRRTRALRLHAGAGVPRLQRPGHQPVAQHHSAVVSI